MFITTEDPTYRYEWLCGHCDYPVEKGDPRCPRCQQMLEDCPVCTSRTHRRPVARKPHPATGGIHCSVCGVQRIGFGRVALGEIPGSFCTNLYGCPAGGLLVASEEFAVLPEDASLCPVCRNDDLKPLDIRTFRYHLGRCVFCSTTFEREPAWKPGWSATTRRHFTVGKGTDDDHPCPICGRNDRAGSDDSADKMEIHVRNSEQDLRETVDRSVYLRLAELGRVLALQTDAKQASDELFALWHPTTFHPSERKTGVTIGSIFDLLQRGTVVSASKHWIQPRRDAIGRFWSRKFPGLWEDYELDMNGGPDT